MPQNIPLALRISWRSADLMWRIAGDTSTDFNHYTKRMTLGAVYGSTLLAWLDDQSEGWADTAAFLDRRIDDVMKFEKFKADWRGSSEASQRLAIPWPPSLPAALNAQFTSQRQAVMIISRNNERAVPDRCHQP